MNVVIQLIDGRQYRCTINDDRASEDFLNSVKYWELFERRMLRIHGAGETWALNPDYIEKVHFMTNVDPGWRPPENIISSKCISQDAYERKLAALDGKKHGLTETFTEGKIGEAVIRITLASGAVEYFEYLAMLKSPLEQKINLSLLFQKVAYTIPCQEGGYVLLNPSRIICIHLHPAPAETVDSAWIVEKIEEDLKV